MAKLAARAKAATAAPRHPQGRIDELERRPAGMARHMARAVVTLVRWDTSTGLPPQREAIVRACAAGLDLFLATAREARPATQEELRRVAQLVILQARSSQSVEPILAAYRIAARVAWEEILRAWRGHAEATPEAIMLIPNYSFAALDEVAATLELPRGVLLHATDPSTLAVLWPADSPAEVEGARQFVARLQEQVERRAGQLGAHVRAGIGDYHPGLHGISRSYLEAQQAFETGRKLRPDSVVHGHDEVIPHLVLTQNPRLAERFVAHSLGRLQD